MVVGVRPSPFYRNGSMNRGVFKLCTLSERNRKHIAELLPYVPSVTNRRWFLVPLKIKTM